MSSLPPSFSDWLFDAIDRPKPQVQKIFTPIIQELHEFLNELDCLQDLQEFRSKFMKGQPKCWKAFSHDVITGGHWYTFNNGGSNEMQFNIGMFGEAAINPPYLRVGMGWAAFGPPRRTVENWFDCFLKVMERDKGRFKYFVDHNALEIEWVHPVKFVSPLHQEGKVVEWLEKHPTPEWIFIGRLLRRGVDRQILENPDKLGSLIQSVFCGFRYFWEQTQYLMNSS